MVIEKAGTAAFKGDKMDEMIRSGIDINQIAKMNNRLQAAVDKLVQCGYTTFLSSLDMGFDMMAATAVLRAKHSGADIRLVAILPFPGRQECFAPLDRERYTELCAAADERVFVCYKYSPEVYYLQNDFLVEHCATLVTYNSKGSGDMNYTLAKAMDLDVPTINLY